MSRRPLIATPSRRLFLRGAGVALALPFLPSALPRASWAQEATSPTRLLFWYVPNGIQRKSMPDDPTAEDWWIQDDGIDGPLAPKLRVITEPLRELGVVDHVSVLTGLQMDVANDAIPGDHARGTGAFLTCNNPKHTAADDILNAVSIDQIAAAAHGDETTFPSLQLGVQEGGNTGDCTAGYSCAYTRNLAWASPTTPLPNITSPAALYDRLFGIDPNVSPDIAAMRKVVKASMLDRVTDDITSLQNRLGSDDRTKLQQYLDAVSEVETRVNGLGGGFCAPGDAPPPDLSFTAHVAAMTDLMVLSLSCDLTRIVTFMLGPAASNQTFDFLGVPGAHHEISHHQYDQSRLDDLQLVARWEVEQFATLVARLRDTPEVDGTLLDGTLAYFSSEIDDGNSHNHENLPVILAGGGHGAHTPGRHIHHPDRPMADLLLSLAQAFGVEEFDRFGDSTGLIENLALEA
jgi:hypothetical protein